MVMTVIDIYHMESRPMYADLKTKRVIRDQEAAKLHARLANFKKGRFVKYEEGIKIPSLGNRIAYGYSYTV